ncbi:hypothetical protein HPP92_001005 [Vanilla planifolia]|uniref:Uncharacterized protein n=1 Tax=Vanilla planifolia TaxID=51239 RepID=A0A835VD60_VANPL|nr:hypothetical protein HPP92_001005 [Vanilla planifolia]
MAEYKETRHSRLEKNNNKRDSNPLDNTLGLKDTRQPKECLQVVIPLKTSSSQQIFSRSLLYSLSLLKDQEFL